jgi:hypothetical protein
MYHIYIVRLTIFVTPFLLFNFALDCCDLYLFAYFGLPCREDHRTPLHYRQQVCCILCEEKATSQNIKTTEVCKEIEVTTIQRKTGEQKCAYVTQKMFYHQGSTALVD